MGKWVWFDMDGTIANLYGVENWLNKLINEDASPYAEARPLVNMAIFARKLAAIQRRGYNIGIISWLSKASTIDYNCKVTAAKIEWLTKHLPSIQWDAVQIVEYGKNKWEICREGILFDDEDKNRDTWGGEAFTPNQIMEILSSIIA